MFRPPGECPVCGSDVAASARACPECGADDRSGWRGEADEETFDYDAFVEEEFGAKPRRRLHPFWWWSALAVLALWIWIFFER